MTSCDVLSTNDLVLPAAGSGDSSSRGGSGSDGDAGVAEANGLAAAVAVVVPTNTPGVMMCVAKDALVRKGFRHKGRGDLDGPEEPAAVCAERIGGINKCRCWTEGSPVAAADVIGPDGKVLAPLPPIAASGGGGGGGASSWLAAVGSGRYRPPIHRYEFEAQFIESMGIR